MRSAGVSCLALLLSATLGCGTPATRGFGPELAAGPAWAIEGVHLLDPVAGAGGPATVLVQGERIVAIAGDEGLALPPRVERTDGAGLYLLPGLWDLHTHLAHADPAAPPLLVTQGVTGVRDMGAKLEEIEKLRGSVLSGEVLGPRIVLSGPALNGAANGPHHRVIGSAAAAGRAVEELAAAGVDFLKTHNATGREAYFALLESAREAGLVVAGHVPTAVDPLEACAAGQESIDHIATIFEGTYLSRFDGELAAFLAMPGWVASESTELVRCMARNQTLFVPTLRAYELRAHSAAAWDDPDPRWRYVGGETYDAWRDSAAPTELDRRADVIALRQSLVDVGIELARGLHRAGAPLGAGTDLSSTGLLPGFDLHAEVRLLARAGLTPREALRAATRGPGVAAGGDPLQGRLVAGAPADLVVLGADAFADLAALDTIAGVVLRGRYLDRRELDAVLASLDRGPLMD